MDYIEKVKKAINQLEAESHLSSANQYWLSELKELDQKDDDITERDFALIELLTPIEFNISSSIPARKQLVVSRRNEVQIVVPFLTGAPLEKALEWLKSNKFSGLWD